MSKSIVTNGAPRKAADTPPTTMNSTPWRQSVSSKATKSGLAVEGTYPKNSPRPVLDCLQTLGGRERQHPVDQSDVDSVFVSLIRMWRHQLRRTHLLVE